MVALSLRMCLGSKKLWWFWGLVTCLTVIATLYRSNLKNSDGDVGIPAKQIYSLRHILEAWMRGRNSTVLRRKEQQIQAELLQRRDGEVAKRESCQPLDSVFMVKTHKCSSSTLTGILFRRAEDRGLRVALPESGVYLSWGEQFNRSSIFMDDGTMTYNIMASHMRLHESDYRAIEQVMEDDAVWITILREPAKQFESLYTYYGWQTKYEVDLHEFLKNPEHYYEGKDPGSPQRAGRNPMLYDNGLDARNLQFGDQNVSRFITVMDKRFDLVLLADFFDESLILLKDIMCWSTEDIAYISRNARTKDSVKIITDAERAAIRRWNWGDYLLYDHFNKTLFKRINTFGIRRMSEELMQLRNLNQEHVADCILETIDSGDEQLWYPKDVKVTGVRVNPDAKNPHLCEQLARPGLKKMRDFAALGREGEAGGSGKI